MYTHLNNVLISNISYLAGLERFLFGNILLVKLYTYLDRIKNFLNMLLLNLEFQLVQILTINEDY
jgi:hypothetical protein